MEPKSGSGSRNNSKSSTGGKKSKNSKEYNYLSGKHRKNYSSTFMNDSTKKDES